MSGIVDINKWKQEKEIKRISELIERLREHLKLVDMIKYPNGVKCVLEDSAGFLKIMYFQYVLPTIRVPVPPKIRPFVSDHSPPEFIENIKEFRITNFDENTGTVYYKEV